jgi:hypothetical protein
VTDINKTSPADMIAIRALPPVGLLGGGDTHFFGLTNGPKILCVGVDSSLAEVLAYKAALIGGVPPEKAVTALRSRRGRDLMADSQLVLARIQPIAIIWEIQDSGMMPMLLMSDGAVFGLSASLAGTVHIAYDVPMVVNGAEFDELAVPLSAPEWTPKHLFTYYVQRAIGGEVADLTFDTSLPPNVSAFFASLEATQHGETDEAPDA